MNIVKKIYCRSVQSMFRIILPILPYKNPQILNSINDIPEILTKHNISNPLIVTDKNLSELGETLNLQKTLRKKIFHSLYLIMLFLIRLST